MVAASQPANTGDMPGYASYQRPEVLTFFKQPGRWYLVDFARSRHANPARIPASGCGFFRVAESAYKPPQSWIFSCCPWIG
jgi:hypothetical protein